jgi:hypothetical protein
MENMEKTLKSDNLPKTSQTEESAKLSITRPGPEGGGGMENIEEALESDISSQDPRAWKRWKT